MRVYLYLRSDGTLTTNQIAETARIVADKPTAELRFVHPRDAKQRRCDENARHIYTTTAALSVESLSLDEATPFIAWDSIDNKLALNQLIQALAYVIREKGGVPDLRVVEGPVSPVRRRELLKYDVLGTVNFYNVDNDITTVFRPFSKELFGKAKFSANGRYSREAIEKDAVNEVWRQRLAFLPTWYLDYLFPRRTAIFA